LTADLHFLRPRLLPGGFIIEYTQADPVIGGIDVLIWRDDRRDDGIVVHCADWSAAHRLARSVEQCVS